MDLVADPARMSAITPGYQQRVQSGFFFTRSSSYVYHSIAQAQQIMKCVAYLCAEVSFAKCSALSLFLAELAVEFWIPNHSVPFRLAGWRKHLWAYFWCRCGI